MIPSHPSRNVVHRLPIITALIILSSGSGVSQTPDNLRSSKPSNQIDISARLSPAAERVRDLNNSMLERHARVQRANPEQIGVLRDEAEAEIERRASALASLIQTHPAQALSLAFSARAGCRTCGEISEVSFVVGVTWNLGRNC